MTTPTCPRCSENVANPYGWQTTVLGQMIILLLCPHCGTVLGITRDDV